MDAKQPGTRRSWQLQIKLKRDTKGPPSKPETYDVELFLDNPANQNMSAPVSGKAAFDLEELTQRRVNLDTYGTTLAACLFKDPPIRARYDSAEEKAVEADVDLRITVFIDPSAPELHAVVWELLAHPKTGARFADNQATPFSRFLYARDLPEIPALRKENVRALIAVPNPNDIEKSGTAEINVRENIELAAAALQGFQVSVMCKPHDPDPSKGPIDKKQADLAAALETLKTTTTIIPKAVTVANLVDAIGEGVDLLYLVCHGHVIIPSDDKQLDHLQAGFGPELTEAKERKIGSPVLWLENADDDRELVSVPGGELARKIAGLGQRPDIRLGQRRIRLAVLASCESAGAERDTTGVSAQAALAPRLAQAGVPAIVAMQGEISMDTAKQFMAAFLANVANHGSIDRAVAGARAKVSKQTDCWMPALFSRLKSGSLWYEAGFRAAAPSKIESIAKQVLANKCTPFVGWGVADRIYGSKADVSQELANATEVPFFPHRKGELALVSQYLHTTYDSDDDAIAKVKDSMLAQMKATLGNRLNNESADLDTVIRDIYTAARTQSPDPFSKELESLRTIARLPAKVFVNACPDRLLEEALLAEGKKPVVFSPQWRNDVVPEVGDSLSATETEPLLIHIFGSFIDETGPILWEDDYLNFLMGIAQNQDRIPNIVKEAFTKNTLMFLGFSLDDWSFRVLFRVVNFLLAGAKGQQPKKPNVAVQIEPDGTLFTGPDEANDFLTKFYAPAKIEPYWGTSADFLTELWPPVEAGLEAKRNSSAR